MEKTQFKIYTFIRTGNVTKFMFGIETMFDITNMEDNVAEAITLQLNLAFEAGHKMTLNSLEKVGKGMVEAKQS